MAHSAAAIANLFLELAKQSGKSEGMTPMKVQKLVFFAHGWYLAIKNAPLVDEQVEAWKFGPVIPSLYRDLRSYGASDVTSQIRKLGRGCVVYEPKIDDSDRDTRAFLSRVWDVYSVFSGIQLSNITHYPDSPWSEVMNAHNQDPPRHTDIPQETIRRHFAAKLAQPLPTPSVSLGHRKGWAGVGLDMRTSVVQNGDFFDRTCMVNGLEDSRQQIVACHLVVAVAESMNAASEVAFDLEPTIGGVIIQPLHEIGIAQIAVFGHKSHNAAFFAGEYDGCEVLQTDSGN